MTSCARWAALGAVIAVTLCGTVASAADIPIQGTRIAIHGSALASRRVLRAVFRDGSIALPDPSFRELPSALVVSGGADEGQCFAAVDLHPDDWTLITEPGGGNAYHFLARYPDGGYLRIHLADGSLSVRARGAVWPCDLSAAEERLPLVVELRLGADRYCAAFDGSVDSNRTGFFRARDAVAPEACPKSDVTIADLNILHGATGIPCLQSDGCRRADRTDLLFRWIAAAGCPDVVTLQEVSDPAVPLLMAHLADTCPFAYHAAYQRQTAIDDQMILSRYPVIRQEEHVLLGGFRHVTFARIDHPVGPLDVFTTHLASGSDGGQTACGPTCPTECTDAGAESVRECQGVQLASFVASRHDVHVPALVTGDFNETPDDFVYTHLVGRGWIDSYLSVGNPECDFATGVGCTSGREDQALTQLEAPDSNEIERIDYVFVVSNLEPSCQVGLDTAEDRDGDGIATRIFTDDPNPFSASCGPIPLPICWPSDHEGVQADVNCAVENEG